MTCCRGKAPGRCRTSPPSPNIPASNWGRWRCSRSGRVTCGIIPRSISSSPAVGCLQPAPPGADQGLVDEMGGGHPDPRQRRSGAQITARLPLPNAPARKPNYPLGCAENQLPLPREPRRSKDLKRGRAGVPPPVPITRFPPPPRASSAASQGWRDIVAGTQVETPPGLAGQARPRTREAHPDAAAHLPGLRPDDAPDWLTGAHPLLHLCRIAFATSGSLFCLPFEVQLGLLFSLIESGCIGGRRYFRRPWGAGIFLPISRSIWPARLVGSPFSSPPLGKVLAWVSARVPASASAARLSFSLVPSSVVPLPLPLAFFSLAGPFV
jgi:hypothetical protein